jgi:dihydrofolate synthase/folylpolyglutamate synthase
LWHDGEQGRRAFLANFAGLTRAYHRVPIPAGQCAMPADRLVDAARAPACGWKRRRREAAPQALSRLAYEVPPRILITGSLYLAGHVLAANGTPPG